MKRRADGPRVHRIEGHEGVGLHVREAGPPDAPAILLLHGWSQHHLSWSKQLAGPLAARFRLVAPDLRGHGASDKALRPEAYDRSEPWAGDVAAIIDALALDRPVAVGWSMGGWVLGDYLRIHGDRLLAGVALVGTTLRTGARADPAVIGRRRPDVVAAGMYSEDQAVALAAALDFVRACAAAPLPKRDLALLTAAQMFCPPQVRRWCRGRDEDWRPAFAALGCPAAFFQGGAERVCLPAMADEAVATIPRCRRFDYPRAGHMPFREDAEAFDRDLAAFAAEAHAVPA